MNTEQKLKKDAEEYRNLHPSPKNTGGNVRTIKAFITGAKSEASKEYWQKQFEKEKLEFAIEQLKKASMLIVSQHERKANLRIIIELEQKLSEL